MNYFRMKTVYCIIVFFIATTNFANAQVDSTKVLDSVSVIEIRNSTVEVSALPFQEFDKKTLDIINANSIGEAARFFSGVQIKDYGGTGGLKTISFRSLGATHTGILYDGLPVADMQAGQIDLGRFSTGFIRSVSLYQANPSERLLPARTFASSSSLAIYSNAYYPQLQQINNYSVGFKAGSFGYKKLSAGAVILLPSKWYLNSNAEFLSSKGNYPYNVNNGNLIEKKKRNNGDIESVQGEINLSKLFNDNSGFHIKTRGEYSYRGLPGAVRFFNDRAVQSLTNRDFFLQLRYNYKISDKSELLFSGKYNHAYTQYQDPDFLNNIGGINDRYKQNESFLSLAFDHKLTSSISATIASDLSIANLWSDKPNFVFPKRISNWTNAMLNYEDSLWKIQTSLLFSFYSDKTSSYETKIHRSNFSPTLAISRRINKTSPWRIRAFYKHIYRLPNFNELYYTILGISSLEPELSKQYNLGLNFTKNLNRNISRINFSIDGYYNQIKDKIIAAPGHNLFSWTMLNLGKVDIKGIDVAVEAGGLLYKKINWDTRLSYTWQNAIDVTDKQSTRYKDRIPYTPDHSGTGMFSIEFESWTAGYIRVFSGKRYTLGENNPFNQLEGWGTQDIFISRKFYIQKTETALRFEINNVSNNQYDIIRYFPMPGRNFLFSMNLKF